jgi:hypothetical protein
MNQLINYEPVQDAESCNLRQTWKKCYVTQHSSKHISFYAFFTIISTLILFGNQSLNFHSFQNLTSSSPGKAVDEIKLLSWQWGLSQRKIPICLFYEWCWDPEKCMHSWLYLSVFLAAGCSLWCGWKTIFVGCNVVFCSVWTDLLFWFMGGTTVVVLSVVF